MCPEISKVVSCHIFLTFCQNYVQFYKSCHFCFSSSSSYWWLGQGSFWVVDLLIFFFEHFYRYCTRSWKIFGDHISKTFSTSTTRRRLLLSNSARRRFAWKLWTNFWQIISRHFLCTARKYKIPKHSWLGSYASKDFEETVRQKLLVKSEAIQHEGYWNNHLYLVQSRYHFLCKL